MARQSLLPRTAPFGDTERASLDAVLGAASPVQRAWLAGFLAGIDAAGGQPAAAGPAAPPKASEPLTILYASESGNSERLAGDAAKLARRQGFKPRVVDFADLDLATLPKAGKLVAIAATWGEGEPPARAAATYAALMGDGAPRLDGVSFGVLALGDTSYVEFCAIGKALDARFEALGAKRAVDRADLDLDFDTPAADWIKGTLKALAPAPVEADNVVAVDFARVGGAEDEDAEPSRDPVVVEVVEHVNLNSSRSDKETIHIALAFEDAVPAYEPGDSLEIYPENDPALVEDILRATGLTGDEALRHALLAERDITTLSPATVERFARATGHADAQAFVEGGEVKAWIEGRHLIDLIETYPASLTAEHLHTITRPLPPRAYSIASSRKEVGDEVHLAIAAVRYETHGRARTGVASTHIADRIVDGAKLRVRLKPNRHFRLPADPATDIIMVGPGTGVAPFRAFVQERRALEAPGRSWLFFGDRHFTHDFLYQLEWQDALEDGSLTRIDVAFSRDQPEKVYVQDRIDQHGAELVEWLDGGAHLYVCGDAKAMAKDVRAAVVRAFAAAKGVSAADAESHVAGLERAKRYQQDVY